MWNNQKFDICKAMFWSSLKKREIIKIEEFNALQTNSERVLFADDLLRKHHLYPKIVDEKKNDEISTKYRQDGNQAFKMKNNTAAWYFYNKSISYATKNSECLALAYANRSAVLYEKKLYKQCLEDITNAFRNYYPKHLHKKLFQRKQKASKLLSTQDTMNYYEKVEKVANLYQKNKRIQCAGAKVEIKKSDVLGRHVVAVEEIKLGEIIAVEKPYVQILLQNAMQDHCHYCLELCYNMIPCDSCVYAMFCSQNCQSLAWDSYHKYECAILHAIYSLKLTKFDLAALRVAIVARNDYGDIENYKPNEDRMYKSQCYEEIHFLETNTHLRDFADLFPKAINAAILRRLVKEGTSLLGDFENPQRDQSIFDELLLRHIQTGTTNIYDISEFVDTDFYDMLDSEIGAGVYAFLSMFNHSCTPNVQPENHGTEMVVRALKPIKKGDELVISYGYCYATTKKAVRQQKLQRQYFFNCVCEACENDWPLYTTLMLRSEIDWALYSTLMGGLDTVLELRLEVLAHLDREEMIRILMHFFRDFDGYKRIVDFKEIIELQETLKQCFKLLGNVKPKF